MAVAEPPVPTPTQPEINGTLPATGSDETVAKVSVGLILTALGASLLLLVRRPRSET